MSFTNKDCTYYKRGKCYLAKAEGVVKLNDPYFDSVHPCDVMIVPCLDDVKKAALKREMARYKKTGIIGDYTLKRILEERKSGSA